VRSSLSVKVKKNVKTGGYHSRGVGRNVRGCLCFVVPRASATMSCPVELLDPMVAVGLEAAEIEAAIVALGLDQIWVACYNSGLGHHIKFSAFRIPSCPALGAACPFIKLFDIDNWTPTQCTKEKKKMSHRL